MTRVLIAGLVALIVSIVVGPKFIEFLRRNELGQHIREEGPEHHVVKQGTPTAGGLLIMVSMSISFLALSRYTANALTVFLVAIGCAAVGFLDDFIKLTRSRSLGLPGRWKLFFLALITGGVAYVTHHRHYDTSVYIPVVNGKLQLSYGWYVLLFVIIAAEFLLATLSGKKKDEEEDRTLSERLLSITPGAWVGRMTGAGGKGE